MSVEMRFLRIFHDKKVTQAPGNIFLPTAEAVGD